MTDGKKDEDKKPRGRQSASQMVGMPTPLMVGIIDGSVMITFDGNSLSIPVDRLPDLNAELVTAKRQEIKRLESDIRKLEMGDVPSKPAPEISQQEYDSQKTAEEPKVVKPKKIGHCYSCDKVMAAKTGQSCAVCKKFSHKTCLENNVCAVCLDNA